MERLSVRKSPFPELTPRSSQALEKVSCCRGPSFIDLTEAGELEPYAELLTEEAGSRTTYERFPIREVRVPEEPKTMAEIIAAIDRAIAEDGIACVHCWGEVVRTGLAVACWLQEHGETPDEALANR